MCSLCDSDRRAIVSNIQRIRINSARIKKLREEKKNKSESLTSEIKSATTPSSKASLRNSKTRSILYYDQQIKSIQKTNEQLRNDSSRRRNSIKSRGKHQK
jgi:hypothetical protein